MLSTFEIVVIFVLVLVLGLAIFWFVVAYKYGTEVTAFSYSRGINVDTGLTSDGKTGKADVKMTCDSSREICVWKATAICTGVASAGNNENDAVDPISNGVGSPYGNFNPKTTVDLTKTLGQMANGKEEYTYKFDGTNIGLTCPITYEQNTGRGTRPQLIANYTCIPKGSDCEMALPPKL